MVSVEYVTDLEFYDWMSIVFRRNKRCKVCDISVSRITNTIDLKDDYGFTRSNGLNFTFGKRYKKLWEIRYECPQCKEQYKPKVFW